MIILKFIFLVMSIPLVSFYLSTILITDPKGSPQGSPEGDLLFIISLLSCYISEIHGGLFKLTLFSQSLEILILGNFFSLEESNSLLSLIPIIVYSNADTAKSPGSTGE